MLKQKTEREREKETLDIKHPNENADNKQFFVNILIKQVPSFGRIQKTKR